MQAKEWIEATFTRLFHNSVDDVIRGLKIMQPASSEAKEKIADLVRYLSNRKDQVNYGAAKRAGYQIGSGAIESANKFIGHVRLKRSGAWWYITNANNILKLRCAKYNDTYDSIICKNTSPKIEKRNTRYLLSNNFRHYAEFRIMPSNIPQSGGSLVRWLILLGIIRDF